MTLGNAARVRLIVWCMTGTARREEGPPTVADPGLIVLGENKMVARAIHHGLIALGGRSEEVRK